MQAALTDADVQAYMKSLTVLYVEDEETTREEGSQFLSRIVGVLITANNGEEGLKVYQSHKPDIVITDIKMPIMDGLTAARRIIADKRKMGQIPPPIVAMTANVLPEDQERAKQAGMVGFVAKPLRREILRHVLEEFALSPSAAKKNDRVA